MTGFKFSTMRTVRASLIKPDYLKKLQIEFGKNTIA